MKTKHIVIYTIIFINVLVFAVATWYQLPISKLGASNNLVFKKHQYWRLLTASFVHVSFLHLVFNMVNLLFIGKVLETAIGKIKFISIYLFAALLSTFVSTSLKTSIVTVGASGSLFAITGLFFCMLHFNIFKPYTKALYYISTINFIVINFCVSLFTASVDFTAHLAGFATGILFFLCFKNKILQPL